MTEITEVKTGAAATTDLICPLMSGQIVPVPGRAGRIDTPGATTLAPSVISCAREKCQWWDETGDACCVVETIGTAISDLNNSIASLRSVLGGSISSIRDVLEPPTESPLVRIADGLVRIGDNIDRIRIAFNKANGLKP